MSKINLWSEAGPPLYLGGLSLVAVVTGIPYFLFPELAALHYDIFARPKGAWAAKVAQVAISPVLAAALGWGVGRLLGYGPGAAVLAAVLAMLLLHLLRSAVAPAISAAVLPVALHVSSIWYVPAILLGTGLLVIGFVRVRHRLPTGGEEGKGEDKRFWAGFPAAIILIFLGVATAPFLGAGFPPPLAVLAYEKFTRPGLAWGKRPVAFVAVLVLAAGAGLLADRFIHFLPLAVVLAASAGILTLRLSKLHLPPALAIGLLPTLVHPGFGYLEMVLAGGIILVVVNQIFQKLDKRCKTDA